MTRFRICFEVNGIAEDEEGFPAPAGMQIDFGEIDKDVDYSEITKDLNISGILAYVGLDHRVSPDAVKIIPPEEYDERYGGEE